MVTVLALLGVLGVLFAAAVLSTREQGLLAEASPDDPDLPLPDDPLTPADVGLLRFSMAARGYRMSEVDLALERLAKELADRDKRIGLLEAAARGKSKPEPVAPVREATPRDLPVPEERVAPAVVVAPQPVEPVPVADPAPPEPVEPVLVADPAAPEPAPVQPAPVPAPVEPPLSSGAAEPLAAPESAGEAVVPEPAPAPVDPPELEDAPVEPPAPTPPTLVEPTAQPPRTPSTGPTAWSSPSAVPAFPVIDAPETDGPPPQPELPSELVAQEQADDRADLDDPADDRPR